MIASGPLQQHLDDVGVCVREVIRKQNHAAPRDRVDVNLSMERRFGTNEPVGQQVVNTARQRVGGVVGPPSVDGQTLLQADQRSRTGRVDFRLEGRSNLLPGQELVARDEVEHRCDQKLATNGHVLVSP